MKKSTLSMIAAGLLAVGGLAQADTPDLSPNTSIMPGHSVVITESSGGGRTYWIDTPVITSAPSVAYVDGTVVDTSVLGAGPVLVPMESSVYVQPGWNGNWQQRHQAAGTFNVPARAGEASTMTNGNPNMLTDNNQLSHDIAVPIYVAPN